MLDELNNILNNDSNISLVHNNDSGVRRHVLASRPLAPGEIIGPSRGIPSDAVLDPLEMLKRHDLGRTLLSVDGGCIGEKMAFWMSLAAMGRDADERRRRRLELEHEKGVGESEAPRKKRKRDAYSARDHSSVGNSVSDPTTAKCQPRQERIFDAYLLSLPREGPDPCCWSDDERSKLLKGTPLAKQIDAALNEVRGEYDQAVAGVANSSDPNVRRMELPPFCIKGRGTFPSMLWARSMHQSRSFPRSLVDEEGVWWMGRKTYVPPSSSSPLSSIAHNGVGEGVPSGKERQTAGDDSERNVKDNGTILSVRLGGWRAPVITIQREPPRPEPKLPPAKQHGSTLGIMIPLYDMLDHKPGHAVQWEAATHDDDKHCIRFRCVRSIAEGEPIWNNYGPKGNGELLSTYGFATRNNVLDSVEGIVLGMRTAEPIPVRTSSDDNTGITFETDADGRLRVYEARMALIKEHSIPHRLENEGRVLLLGPFSLHRKFPPMADEGEEETSNKTAGADDAPEECGGGVIPDDLYRALSFIGMEDVDEGPVVSEDELGMLQDVLTKKLDGFKSPVPVLEAEAARENDGGSSVAGATAGRATHGSEQSLRTESVQAYKDGQIELLQLALAELDALMPCDGQEEEMLPS